jgi:hypothetical protein
MQQVAAEQHSLALLVEQVALELEATDLIILVLEDQLTLALAAVAVEQAAELEVQVDQV